MTRPIAAAQQWMMTALTPLAIALVAMVGSLAVYDYYLSKKNLADELDVLARITLQRSGQALLQTESQALRNQLSSLKLKQGVKKACLYTPGYQLIASAEPGKCAGQTSALQLQSQDTYTMVVIKPFTRGDSIAAYLAIEAQIPQPKWHWLLLLTLVTMAFFGFVWWLNHRYHSQLSFPAVTLNLKKYDNRADDGSIHHVSSFGDEELERLIAVFNQLPDITNDKKEQMQELVVRLKDKFLQLEFKAASFEEKDKAIRQMFAGASHDLRQPLQAMTMFVEALKPAVSQEQKKLVENLDLAISNLNTMFSDLLDVSKLESRIENVRFAPVYVKPLLERLYKEFSVVAQNKGLQLRLHTSDLIIESNDTMLERMVRNLLSNAIRYTQTGGVLLACRMKAGMVSIEIWDTGPGIPEDKMAIIFDQFVQLENSNRQSQQGLGLGLSIIKRLNDLMEHQLSVESRLGRGSVFKVSAPVYIKRKRRVTAQPMPKMDLAQPPTEFRQDMSIVLIDDDATIRESMEALLRSWGMQVVSFDSVNAIWDYYSENGTGRADLIISDFQLSRTETAFDAIAILRLNLEGQVPVLIITGASDENVLEDVKGSGYPYMKKPVKPAKLRAMMQYIVNSAQ